MDGAMDRLIDQQTNKASYRIAGPQVKTNRPCVVANSCLSKSSVCLFLGLSVGLENGSIKK